MIEHNQTIPIWKVWPAAGLSIVKLCAVCWWLQSLDPVQLCMMGDISNIGSLTQESYSKNSNQMYLALQEESGGWSTSGPSGRLSSPRSGCSRSLMTSWRWSSRTRGSWRGGWGGLTHTHHPAHRGGDMAGPLSMPKSKKSDNTTKSDNKNSTTQKNKSSLVRCQTVHSQ